MPHAYTHDTYREAVVGDHRAHDVWVGNHRPHKVDRLHEHVPSRGRLDHRRVVSDPHHDTIAVARERCQHACQQRPAHLGATAAAAHGRLGAQGRGLGVEGLGRGGHAGGELGAESVHERSVDPVLEGPDPGALDAQPGALGADGVLWARGDERQKGRLGGEWLEGGALQRRPQVGCQGWALWTG